jgi:hypothetical protein
LGRKTKITRVAVSEGTVEAAAERILGQVTETHFPPSVQFTHVPEDAPVEPVADPRHDPGGRTCSNNNYVP